MARISADELERLNAEVSLERLAQAKGVKLERRGEALVGLCFPYERSARRLEETLRGRRDRLAAW